MLIQRWNWRFGKEGAVFAVIFGMKLRKFFLEIGEVQNRSKLLHNGW